MTARRSSYRLWQIASLLLVLAMIMTACPPPAGTPAADEGGEAAATAAPAEGGAAPAVALPADAAPDQVLRINTGSTGSASFTFYPMSGGGDHQSWMPLLYVPPLYFDADLNLKPGVFSEWTSSDDFTEWTFTIDPRAQWSDGSPITAADVKGTWELMTDPLSEQGRIPQYMGSVEGFADVREAKTAELSGLTVVDERTIQVKLIKPDPILHWRLATTHMNPLKAEMLKADRQNAWLPENNPVYSGPYMIESYDPDLQEAVLIPNPNWWMDEGPYLSRIEIRFQPEPETLAVELENDQADLSLGGLPFALKEQFPDYFRPIKAFGFNNFWLAATITPTNDINVRKALVLAVDQAAVFKAAYPLEGEAVMANGNIDPDLPCVDPDNTWYTQDIEAAKAALAASPFGSAENLPKLRVTPRGSDAALNRALENVVEQWRQNLGITNIEFQSQPDAFGADVELINLSRDDAVIRFPDAATYMWVSTHSAGPIANDMMRGYKNEELDAMLDAAVALAVDDPNRCATALEAQRKFMDDYQMLFVGIPNATLNAREYVGNYFKGPDVGVIEPWKIYIKAH